MDPSNKNRYQFMSESQKSSPNADRHIPLLSVVIPTRNRAKYAISAIESILTFTTDPRLELVIQDNSDSRELEQYVNENFGDDRLRYNYTESRLACTENFNKAIALSTGEYICIISDEDGINPEIMVATSWARDHDVDVISLKHIPYYLWPDTEWQSTLFTQIEGGLLRILESFDGTFRPFDVSLNVHKYLRTTSVTDIEFVKLFHGILRRSCLETIYARNGFYLNALCIDIYASMALSEVAKKAFLTYYPLTISGACNSNTEIHNPTGSRKDILDLAIQLRGSKGYKWDALIPRFYSIETIIAESAIAALRHNGRAELAEYFNIPRFIALCFARCHKNRIAAISHIYRADCSLNNSKIITSFLFIYYLLIDTTTSFAKRLINRLRIFRDGEGVARYRGLGDMNEVTKALINHLSKSGKRIETYLP